MIDRHHVLYNRRAWEATDDLKHLRNSKQLIVPLERETHNELHRTISHVPPLSYHIARRALYTFIDTDAGENYLKAIENMQRSIEEATFHPKADIIERRVAETAVFALQLQKPFVRENMPTTIIDLGQYRNRRRPKEFYDDEPA